MTLIVLAPLLVGVAASIARDPDTARTNALTSVPTREWNASWTTPTPRTS